MFYKQVDEDGSLILHTDLYEINMMCTYFKEGISEEKAAFEIFYRKEPFGNGFVVFAGLEHTAQYLNNLHLGKSDLASLEETQDYDDNFIEYLRNLELDLTVRSTEGGQLVFASEPIVQIEGPPSQCQLVETTILNIVNFQTLLATKAARIKLAVGPDALMEFGVRRAQETDAALWGARAAYIGGFDATSNVRAAKLFGIPASGTHVHALVQAFGNEYAAFRAYAQTHKDCIFLVDTYDTVRSGVPTAIKAVKEMSDKINFLGVRIDSGDVAYISKQVRKQLDDAGFKNTKVFASNNLGEKTITNLKMQGAKIDVWGIGTKFITAPDQPALGAVYRLVAIGDENGNWKDSLKISSNAIKIPTPGKKQVWRICTNSDRKNEGDWVARTEEDPRNFNALFIFHQRYIYINKVVTNFTAKPLLKDIFIEGRYVDHPRSFAEIKAFCQANLENLWDEYKRSLNPQECPVDLSQNLYESKIDLISEIRTKIRNQGLH